MITKTGLWVLEITFCSYSQGDRTFAREFDLHAENIEGARREADELYRQFSFRAEEKAEQDVDRYVPMRAQLLYKERVLLFAERI